MDFLYRIFFRVFKELMRKPYMNNKETYIHDSYEAVEEENGSVSESDSAYEEVAQSDFIQTLERIRKEKN